MYTKAEVINQAFDQLRISGITFIPSAAQTQKALGYLESMMAQWASAYAFNCGYNFEITPNTASTCGPDLTFKDMMAANLAVRLAPSYGKEVPPSLDEQATMGFTAGLGIIAQLNSRMLLPPERMPRGSGNTFRLPWWNRFSTPIPRAPVAYSTEYIQQGETLNLYTDFSDVLQGATILAFTVTADPLLTIDSDTLDSPRINYTVTAPANLTNTIGPWQQVQFNVSTSTGQTLIRTINFGVSTPPVVGPNA